MAVRYGTPQFLQKSTVRAFCEGTVYILLRCLNVRTKRTMQVRYVTTFATR